MARRRARIAWGSVILASVLALATGGMSVGPPEGPVRMANLEVSRLFGEIRGFAVIDSAGAHIGKAISVDTDHRGLARWISIALEEGGEARLASFRAWLDAREQTIALELPEDIVQRRAEAALNSPSAGI